MDLTYDEATREFRGEVSDFLAANTASFPTKSYDTAEGFFVEISSCPYCAGNQADLAFFCPFDSGMGDTFNILSPSRWTELSRTTAGENFGDMMRRIGL